MVRNRRQVEQPVGKLGSRGRNGGGGQGRKPGQGARAERASMNSRAGPQKSGTIQDGNRKSVEGKSAGGLMRINRG